MVSLAIVFLVLFSCIITKIMISHIFMTEEKKKNPFKEKKSKENLYKDCEFRITEADNPRMQMIAQYGLFVFIRYDNGIFYYKFSEYMGQEMSDKNSKIYKAWYIRSKELGIPLPNPYLR